MTILQVCCDSRYRPFAAAGVACSYSGAASPSDNAKTAATTKPAANR